MTYEELKKAYEEAAKKCSELEKENDKLVPPQQPPSKQTSQNLK